MYFMREILHRLPACVALSFGFSVAAVFGQVEPPQVATPTVPSDPYVLELSVFATHTGVGAIDTVSPNDGTGDVFVSASTGEIFRYDSGGTLRETLIDFNSAPFQSASNFRSAAAPGGNTGRAFRGLAYFDFHPEFAVSGSEGEGKVFATYEVTGTNETYDAGDFLQGGSGGGREYVISEFTVDTSDIDNYTVDPNSIREVYSVRVQGDNSHGIGEVAFNPLAQPGDEDYGLLYAAIGDANANGNTDPALGIDGESYIQNLNNPFGSIIRIDPLEQTNGDAFGVPESNPFVRGTFDPIVSGAPTEVAEEIYALGLRNPATFTFNRDLNGETVLINADTGGDFREEINLIRPGQNYGWEAFEGTLDLNNLRILPSGQRPDNLDDTPRSLAIGLDGETIEATPPVLEFSHGDFETTGRAVIGGVVVSDPNDPDFQNQLIFADLVNGNLFHADYFEVLEAEANGTQAEISVFEASFDFNGDGNIEQGDLGDVLDGIEGGRSDARFGFNSEGELFITIRSRVNVGDIGSSDPEGFLGSNQIFSTGLFAAVLPLIDTPGDVNGDGVVDLADFEVIRTNFFNTGVPGEVLGEASGAIDGTVDLEDFLAFRAAFDAAGGDVTLLSLDFLTAVPEPTSAAMIASGLFVVGVSRRRQTCK